MVRYMPPTHHIWLAFTASVLDSCCCKNITCFTNSQYWSTFIHALKQLCFYFHCFTIATVFTYGSLVCPCQCFRAVRRTECVHALPWQWQNGQWVAEIHPCQAECVDIALIQLAIWHCACSSSLREQGGQGYRLSSSHSLLKYCVHAKWKGGGMELRRCDTLPKIYLLSRL